MEIEMNKIESDAYYNEVLAIISTLTVIALAFLVVFSVLYLQNRSNSIRFGHNL